MPTGGEDLGDVVLLPGLVNAHTHLEFSDLDDPIGKPGIPLHQWIGQVVSGRLTNPSQCTQAAVQTGIQELIGAGTKLVGEITTPPCSYEYDASKIEVVKFAEVLGLDSTRSEERFAAAMEHNQVHSLAGFSPHAPYSTTPQTVSNCVDTACRLNRPIAMHVAESPDERELLISGRGPFADALQAMGVWLDGIFPWDDDPFALLIKQLSNAPRGLLIHGNYLDDREIEQLAKFSKLSVVYCPRTHQFFQHTRHPLDRMLAAGIRVALGTDSRASNPDLNLWNEVRFLLNRRSDIAPHQVLQMATMNGADAMGNAKMGRIAPGCRPGLGIVESLATSIEDVFADLAVGRYRRTS